MASDLRLALRNLLRSPRFALVAIGSIGFGIAAVCSIFSFVNAILLNPLPVPGADRIVVIQDSIRGRTTNGSPARLFDWQRAAAIASVTGYYGESFTVQFGEIPERIPGVRIFGDPLATLNVRPAIGRGFTAEERKGRGSKVALLSDNLWRTRFAADPGVLGRTLRMNNESVEIIGVLPPGVELDDADLLTPEPNQDMPRAASFLAQIARLRDGVGMPQAQSEMQALAVRLRTQYPDTDAGLDVHLSSYRDQVAGTARTPLLILLAAVALVLLMACINVASLSLSRIAGRSQELAIRQALGAGRARLIRMLLSESLLLSISGAVLGVLGSAWAVDWLRTVAPSELPRLRAVTVDLPVLAFAALLTLISTCVAGLLPAFRFSRTDVNDGLKNGSRGSARGQHLQSLLVIGQLALSLALLTGGGLLFRSLWNLQHRPLGYSPDRLLSFRLSLPWQTEPEQLHLIYGRVLDRLREMPGVEAAALTDRLPFDGGTMNSDVVIAGRAAGDIPAGSQLAERVVSPGYHDVLKVPLRAGRYLTDADAGQHRTVINESAARVYFAGQNPLGQHIGLRWKTAKPRPQQYWEIVGIVADLPGKMRESTAEPAMYVPFAEAFWPLAHFVIRTKAAPSELARDIRREIARIDSSQAVELVQTGDEFLNAKNATSRLQAWLVGIFAATALLLAAIGLYGLIAAGITSRQKEIGIRIALGAAPHRVRAGVLAGTLRLALTGTILGLALSAFFAIALRSGLYGVAASDPATYAVAIALLLAVALVTAWWPAHRASRIDPMQVLRRD